MCDVREWGDGAAAVSGWSKKEERERYWEAESKRGGFSVDWKRLCVSSRWTIVCWVLGSGCWEFSLCPGWPILYPVLHLSLSPQPWALLHSVLFAVVLCLTMYLTFVNLFSYKTERLFSFLGARRVIFLRTGCFVLSEEQVGRLVVTGEECWVELFQPVRWLSLPKDWMQRPPHKSPATQTGREENSCQTMRLITAGAIIHMHHHLPYVSNYLNYLGKICYCTSKTSIKSRERRWGISNHKEAWPCSYIKYLYC